MKLFNIYILIIFSLFPAIILEAQPKSSLTLKDIYASNKFIGKTVSNIQWLPDGLAFTYTKKNSDSGLLNIYKHDVKNGEDTLLIEGSAITYNGSPVAMSSYSWTGDGKYLLIEGPVKSIWRHSRQAPYYLYNLSDKSIITLADNYPGLRNVKLSPDGKFVGFVKDHNIYILNILTGEQKALTNDGNDNILNGEFDWVYEEEFGLADAWRWSPDSKKIAFWHFNQTRVKDFYLIDEMTRYNTVTSLKYPEAGEQDAVVTVGVIDIPTGKTKWMDIGKNDDIYIPRIYWTNSPEKLAILRLNRKQNFLELLMADSNTGESKVTITDSDTAWVNAEHDIIFLKKKDQIVWTSEKSGYNHAYLYSYNGKLINQITNGNWEVTSVEGLDEDTGMLFLYGKKDSPLEQNIYRVKLDGSGFQKISAEHGWHTANFSPHCKYYIDSYSDAKTPAKTILCNNSGRQINILQKNIIPALGNYNMVYPEFLTFKTTDGIVLNAYMIKPFNFNPKKKYPVLVFGYGGPGSQMVVNRWGGKRTLWHQLMTEHGYIVFCVDNRGTGGRGKAFKNLAYGDLSKWAVNDQIEGAKYLAALPYVDTSRLGFWGWSGGGYLTLMMVTRGADYFKTGVAVAPVSDFRLYDNIWTERYMGLPQENIEGYKAANALNYANLLKGKLLMIHGTGDDNVHYQNTLQMANKFISQLKQFDLMLYPNRNHGIYGGNTQLHLFTKITNYFLDNL